MLEWEVTSHSPQQTHAYGVHLGRALTSGAVIGLSADLGGGKTTFARGVGEGWGALQAITSPTFVIVHEYTRATDAQRLYHLDAYRLESVGDVESIGLEDMLDTPGAVLIEWAENLSSHLPPDHLWISFHPLEDENMRRIHFRAGGVFHTDLLTRLQEGWR